METVRVAVRAAALGVRSAWVLIALLLLATSAAPATAQEDDANVMREMGPLAFPVSRTEVEAFDKLLGLDKDQHAAAMDLYRGYRSAFQAMIKDANAKAAVARAAMQQSQDWKDYGKKRFELMKVVSEKAGTLEAGFFDDLKALLTADQAAKFPRAERARRRAMASRFGITGGEGVDLIAVLKDLKIDPAKSPDLAAAVDQYEAEIDKPFAAREKALKNVITEMGKAMGGDGEPEEKAMEGAIKPIMQAALQGRDINRKYTRLVAGLLPEAQRDPFEREVKARSFPKVYGPGRVTKSIDEARKMADATEQQRGELDSIRAGYERDAAPVNDRWAVAIAEKQEKLVDNFQQGMMGMWSLPETDPLVRARKDRAELDERAMKRLNDLLTPAQREKLPAVPPQSTDHPGSEVMPDFERDDSQYKKWESEADE